MSSVSTAFKRQIRCVVSGVVVVGSGAGEHEVNQDMSVSRSQFDAAGSSLCCRSMQSQNGTKSTAKRHTPIGATLSTPRLFECF